MSKKGAAHSPSELRSSSGIKTDPIKDKSRFHAAILRDIPPPDGEWSDEHEELFLEAVLEHRARCLWNIKVRRSIQGLKVIENCLRREGNMETWRLANRIREKLADAIRHLPEENIGGSHGVAEP